MHILLTNHALAERTGSELFTRDLAGQLTQAGHTVEIFAPRVGALAEELQGVAVHDHPAKTAQPDVIHAQHHLPAMAALTCWQNTPAIYHCHGFRPWEERIPIHPRILAYATISPRLIPWMTGTCGIDADKITPVPNFVDTARFDKIRPLPERPAKALLFSNRTEPGPSLDALRAACAQTAISLDTRGAHFGNKTASPETLLPEYDLVFATGRSALEALACGCAVICQSDERCSFLVTPENFDMLRERNFSIPVGSPAFDTDLVVGQIRQYRKPDAELVTQRVRAECGGEPCVASLLPLYEKARASLPPATSALRSLEHQALADYLVELDKYLHHGDLHFSKIRAGWQASRRKLLKARSQREERKKPFWRWW